MGRGGNTLALVLIAAAVSAGQNVSSTAFPQVNSTIETNRNSHNVNELLRTLQHITRQMLNQSDKFRSISQKLQATRDLDHDLELSELWQQGVTRQPSKVLLRTQLCATGQFVSHQGCQDCHPGTYLLSFSPHSHSSCTECEPGTYQPEAGAHECHACPVGKFAPMSGSPSCTDCEPGTFGDASGATGCKECTRGSTYQMLPGKQYCDLCGVAPEGLTQRCGADAVASCEPDGWACVCRQPNQYFSNGKCNPCLECELGHRETKPCRSEANRECIPMAGLAMLKSVTSSPVDSGLALAGFLLVLLLELLPSHGASTPECRLDRGDKPLDASYEEVLAAVEFVGGFMSGISKQSTNFASLINPYSGVTSGTTLGQVRRASWGLVQLHLTKAFNELVIDGSDCCWAPKLPAFLNHLGCVAEATIRAIQDTPIASTEYFKNFLSFLSVQMKGYGTNAISVAEEIVGDESRKLLMGQAIDAWHSKRWGASEAGNSLGQALHPKKFALSWKSPDSEEA
eukprot:c25660_g1_i1.p1 GENE.c25660_g1_i1~~c25660_g1_i1.p1  ORF type:complete len:513 (-),score=66.79 c25660_g1_i1:48-1586(-)